MKHTNEFLAACFAAYPNVQVIEKFALQEYLRGEYTAASIIGIVCNEIWVTWDSKENRGVDSEIDSSEMLMVLRPLSDITDEDAIEVAKICGLNTWETHKVSDQGRWVYIIGFDNSDIKEGAANDIDYAIQEADGDERMIRIDSKNGTVYKGEEHDYNEMFTLDVYINVIDFLRSRSYDCGFRNIPSLIEAGIAIAAE